jgi:hypothetical protein
MYTRDYIDKMDSDNAKRKREESTAAASASSTAGALLSECIVCHATPEAALKKGRRVLHTLPCRRHAVCEECAELAVGPLM